MNSRLDEIQAAILRERLALLPRWTETRRTLAAAYRAGLEGAPVRVPRLCDPGHVYHLFPVLTPQRDRLQAHLREHGIETLVHYPVPIPRQPALAESRPDVCPVADRVCGEVCSLPLHPALPVDAVRAVVAAVRQFEADPARSADG